MDLRSATIAVAPTDPFLQVAPWLAVLAVLVLIGGVVILALRRSLQNPGEGDDEEGFTLHGLRRLHAEGKLTDVEFEQAKAAMIGRVRARAATDDPDVDAGPDAAPAPVDEGR